MSLPKSKPQRIPKPIKWLVLALLLGFVGGIVMGVGGAFYEEGLFPSLTRYMLPVVVVVGVIGAVGSMWIGYRWMQSIDEAAQEAHKWAWFWGGSAAMALSMVLLFIGMTPMSKTIAIPSAFSGRTDPAAYATTGALWLLVLMVAGYSIAWGIWWLRHR